MPWLYAVREEPRHFEEETADSEKSSKSEITQKAQEIMSVEDKQCRPHDQITDGAAEISTLRFKGS